MLFSATALMTWLHMTVWRFLNKNKQIVTYLLIKDSDMVSSDGRITKRAQRACIPAPLWRLRLCCLLRSPGRARSPTPVYSAAGRPSSAAVRWTPAPRKAPQPAPSGHAPANQPVLSPSPAEPERPPSSADLYEQSVAITFNYFKVWKDRTSFRVGVGFVTWRILIQSNHT